VRPLASTTEFWVFLPGTELPSQEQMMHRMLAENPYKVKGSSPVGPKEGILFSDIRTHIALALRSKNPNAFRPDIFTEDAPATPEQVAALDESQSFVKVRYLSEEPLPDKRHLTFVLHAVDAIAELGGAKIVYDVVADRLWDRAALAAAIRDFPPGTSADQHVNAIWKPTAFGGYVQTKGLHKIGLSDLTTLEMQNDEQVLVLNVIGQAARAMWDAGAVPNPFEVEAFSDRFNVVTQPAKDGRLPVRIMRVQAT
ncbi:MAG TPA: hypothetical protein VG944_12350, partial [Fimbriimonas sp.]|nr:hypothetical protein [Fimbriimonas sp.]